MLAVSVRQPLVVAPSAPNKMRLGKSRPRIILFEFRCVWLCPIMVFLRPCAKRPAIVLSRRRQTQARGNPGARPGALSEVERGP